jgi:hypothetical protein
VGEGWKWLQGCGSGGGGGCTSAVLSLFRAVNNSQVCRVVCVVSFTLGSELLWCLVVVQQLQLRFSYFSSLTSEMCEIKNHRMPVVQGLNLEEPPLLCWFLMWLYNSTLPLLQQKIPYLSQTWIQMN